MKVGQVVTIDEVMTAGWMFSYLCGDNFSFVNDDNTLGVTFLNNAKEGTIVLV